MRLTIIAVGRLKQGPERELAERYLERFDDVGRKLGFRGLEIHEIPESRARDAASRIAEEAAAISAAIPPKSVMVALDERGDNIDSGSFADASQRLEPLTAADHTFRHTARELLALAAWRAGDTTAAKRWIEMINTDPGTPPDERNRMEMLGALMASEDKT